jgi:glycosyltransferase involved in cell wall biosynthesis
LSTAVRTSETPDTLDEPSRPWIAYIGPLAYPARMAASTRVLGISMALMHAGFDVMILGDHPSQSHAEQAVLARSGEGRSVCYVPVLHRNLSSTRGLARLANLYWLAACGAIDWLSQCKSLPECVIYYGSRCVPTVRVSAWCRRNKVPVVADVVEHMEGRQFPFGGAISPFFLDHLLYRHAIRNRFDGLLCISAWLEMRYRDKGMPTSVVRTTLDTDAIEPRIGSGGSPKVLKLGYAGSTASGKKDLLGVVVEAVLHCRAHGMVVTLDLAGVSTEELCTLLPRDHRDTEAIRALGWLPRERALNLIRDCDFMPLLRHDSMYAWAGFPTKVAESLALGTPVIVNPVGDVKDIVVDGYNGFHCQSVTVAGVTAALVRAYDLTDGQAAKMRQAARNTAVNEFDYRRKALTLARFASDVVAAVARRGQRWPRGQDCGTHERLL